MSIADDRVWQDDSVARRYLEGVRGAIPLAAEQVDVVLRLIRARQAPVRRVLDLGCGDGFLAAPILEAWPESRGVLVDFSDVMLEAARKRFEAEPDRVAIQRVDYGKPGWRKAVEGRFDVIVSGFSIHHQPDERKRSLYGELFEMLEPGGIFLNVEHVSSPTPWLEEQATEHLIDAMFAYHSRRGSKSRDEIAAELVRRDDKQANILAPVELQGDWLREIGFQDVDCFLKIFELAVFGGRKTA
ncbi:MAG: class I SAM-dependent methyltransferase [Bryobacterales bacterium]|nr:class I SAM-dependent methyltransferase [Bryobacterales bacterium]